MFYFWNTYYIFFNFDIKIFYASQLFFHFYIYFNFIINQYEKIKIFSIKKINYKNDIKEIFSSIFNIYFKVQKMLNYKKIF